MTTLLAAQFEPRSWVFVAAAAAATFVVLTGLQRFKRRRETFAATSATASESIAPMPQAAERWQLELHDFTREAEARLDTKLALMQRLIVTADERIAYLESLGLDAPQRATKDQPIAGPHYSTAQAAPQGQARTSAIFAMADAGNNAASIANRLGTPIAEVELILSLRRTATK